MNTVLHAITNRSGDFVSDIFPSDTSYKPVVLSSDAAALRKFLQLDNTSHDYYVVGCLAALNAFPELLESLGSDDQTFDLTRYQRPEDVTNLELIPGPYGPPNIKRVATEFPAQLDMRLVYESPTVGVFSLGNRREEITVDVDTDSFAPAWPVWAGVAGAVDAVWSSTIQFNIRHTPISFPYDALAEKLDQNRDKNMLLLATDLLTHYFSARSGIEKVATVATALALSNPAFSWPKFKF